MPEIDPTLPETTQSATDNPAVTAEQAHQSLPPDTILTIMTGMTLEAWQRERELARRDKLTGIPNRVWLVENLTRCIDETPGEVSLAMVDLDDLKKTNDTRGHEAGNLLLISAAHSLQASMDAITASTDENTRLAHAAVRLSGDEYLLLIQGVSDQQRLDSILQQAVADLAEVGIGASVGGRPHIPGENATELIAAVDKLMYQEKDRRWAERYRSIPLRKRLAYWIGTRAIAYSGLNIRRQHDPHLTD